MSEHSRRLDHAVFSEHARLQMRRRRLDVRNVRAVLDQPESVSAGRPGRVVVQARLPLPPSGKVYLVRIVVDVDRLPPEVVTAYRTRRFARYGSQPP
jgi:hypothetical protein